ncbi:tyrosine-type recombinase/integrase [Tunturiibacter lichenicola]|uniref:tyrosine-type recombinase/integrase n=1 Tax=Tunturiibacter lichenicola TaxID=2051959 RepID=UPI0021B192A9|nr:site-specific integrase [Edaphobacter lichenicola]
MKLNKKTGSPFWWYDFYFEGKRHRGSTGEKTRAAAGTVAAATLTRLTEGSTITKRGYKAPILREFATRFLTWSQNSSTIKPNTQRYYKYGWRLLSMTILAQMPIDQITAEQIDIMKFRRPVIDRRTRKETGELTGCSRAYTNQALRTLKVMLGKAREWKVLTEQTSFTIPEAPGRKLLINDTAELALERELGNSSSRSKMRYRAWLITMIMQDTGMRPSEVFEIRLENLLWAERRIWIPSGKTAKSRRFVGMTERMHQLLSSWCHGSEGPGWLFPSNSKTGHLMSIAGSFQAARDRAGLDGRLVPYSARHTYATYAVRATGNLFAVRDQMGHVDIKSMDPYQHQETEELVVALNKRNSGRGALSSVGHTFGHTNRLEASKTA